MYELVNKQSFLNSGMPSSLAGWTRRSVPAAGGWERGYEAGGVRPVGAAGRGGASQEGGAFRGGGGVMAEAVLEAVRKELREFPVAARGEWVPSGRGRGLGSEAGASRSLLGRRHRLAP